MKILCGRDILIVNCVYLFLLKAVCGNNMKVYPMRLCPGVEIKSSILEFVTSNQLNAAFILSCCGSIRKATLRFATSADQTHQVCYMKHNS
jgi:predicted DNA-binding protein with PD1-like motif